MAGLKAPTSFTAGRRIKLFGVTYQPGDAVPNAVVKTVKRMNALIARRILVPNRTLRGSKHMLTTTPAPNDLNPKQRAGL